MEEVGNLSLFLQNPTIVPVYRLYCCGLHLEHYVDLYVDINEYAANPDPNKQKLAKSLFEKYFTKESLQRVDINSRVIDELNNKLARDDINAHVFSDVQTFILEFLKEKTLIGFLESPAYLKIIQRRKERASVFKKEESDPKEEIENLSKKIREYQTFFTSLTAQVSKTLDSRETSIRNWNGIAQSLEQFSKTAENPNMQMALQTAKVIGVMEELQAKMNRVLVKNLENSLNNLVKSEISASGAAKKKFDSTKKPQKGDPIVSETLTTLNDCNFKCDHQLQIGLCSILEEYYKLFETGHFYMHRNLPTLMDFRTTIQLDEMKDEGEEFQIGTRVVVADQEIIKEGSLEKKGAKRRNWNQRWFVLKSKYLFYYNNNTEKILKGYIYLKNCTIESSYNKKKANCFSISTTFRTFLISASTEKEMKEWIQAIKSATFEAQAKLAEQSQKKQLETLLDAQANDFISDYLSTSNSNPSPPQSGPIDSSENSSGPLAQSPPKDSSLGNATDKGIETAANETDAGSGKKKKDRSTKKSSQGKSRRTKGSKLKKSKKEKEVKEEGDVETASVPAEPVKNLESLKNMLEASINDIPTTTDDNKEESDKTTKETVPAVIETAPVESAKDTATAEPVKEEDNEQAKQEPTPSVKAKTKKSRKKGGDSDDDDDYDESEEEEEGNSEKEEPVEVEQNKRLSRKATLMSAIGDSEPTRPSSETTVPEEVKQEEEEEEDNQPRQSAPPSKGLNVLVKQGYLTKKGAKRRNWNTRWFILKHNHLAYYKNPGDREPKGVVILANCKVEPCDKKPYCFAIASSMRTYFIFAKNSAAQEEWMAAIKSCIP